MRIGIPVVTVTKLRSTEELAIESGTLFVSYLKIVYLTTIRTRDMIKDMIGQIGWTNSFSSLNSGASLLKAMTKTPPIERKIPKISIFFKLYPNVK